MQLRNYVTTLWESTHPSVSARIGISFSSSTRRSRPRFLNRIYLRAGSMVLSISLSSKVTLLTTLQNIAVALILYPLCIAYQVRNPVYYTPSTLVDRFLTVYQPTLVALIQHYRVHGMISLIQSCMVVLTNINACGFSGIWRIDGSQSVPDLLKCLTAYAAYHMDYIRSLPCDMDTTTKFPTTQN